MAHILSHFFPTNTSFSFETLRAAGYANYGGADLSEIIAICSQIPDGDEDNWLREWRDAGDRAVENAKASLARRNVVGAREAFLRASNYYRTAEFYRRENPFEEAVSKELAGLSTEAFYSAMDHMPHITQKVKIKYEDTTLPGTLMRPDNSGKPRPTLIANGGFDSTREELFFYFGPAAIELGFNILLFDGPGQGEALREQRLFFRPDWEKVITPVVDYALSHDCVNKDQIFVLGISMGGYLVARAAAFEHRTSAIILDDGVYDFATVFRHIAPEAQKAAINNSWENVDTGVKWAVSNAKWTFGVASVDEVLQLGEDYVLGDLVKQIRTPMLVMDAPDDHFLKGQPKELFDRLPCEKEFVEMTRQEGASTHCSSGALARTSQVIFDYLMQRL